MELPFVQEMFESIAPRYDFLNRLLSLRQDILWRRKMVAAMRIPPGGRVLDVACGTGDVAFEVLRQKGEGVLVCGIDFAVNMLQLAVAKRRRFRRAATAMPCLAGDAFHPPFVKGQFDALTIAFGIRNIVDRETVLAAFHDQLKPGGQLLVLELATPEAPFMRRLYLLYFQRLLPLVGGLFSRNRHAYTYLPESVLHFPRAAAFGAMMRRAGFTRVRWKPLTLGVANLFVGEKTAEKLVS